jgi:hypothetical protein
MQETSGVSTRMAPLGPGQGAAVRVNLRQKHLVNGRVTGIIRW